MARPKKNIVQLTDAEAEQLKCVLQKNNTCQTLVNRCRVLLALDENHPPVRTYDECVALFCISRPTISHVAKTYVNDGLEAVLKIKRNVNSDNARRKVDGHMEAGIVEIACGPVPEGHSRWTIRLLEGQAKIEFDEPVSREAIRRTLKKIGSGPTAASTGVSQTRQMQNLQHVWRIFLTFMRCLITLPLQQSAWMKSHTSCWAKYGIHGLCAQGMIKKWIQNIPVMEPAASLPLLSRWEGCTT